MDVSVFNHGSVFLFTLKTPAARARVDENVQLEGWQWVGANAFAVDHRYADQLAAGMEEAGLEVG